MQPNERYLCVHGHFYQPPRENPWLEAVEIQDSAYPYHDWNERITAECYGPNALSRILDDQKKIREIISNYALMSFNIGPTLMSWLQRHSPEIYAMIIESDRRSAPLRSGHGSAIAQGYSHMIMPLASPRDKRTQVIWGVRDFECRFGRKPEGMWLPETAVDLETLDLLAEHGVLYTILAPHQAHRVRPARGAWADVSGGRVDPSRPYQVNLKSGRRIAVFFYDSPISHAVAFEGLLNSGEVFSARLMGGFSDGRQGPQLMHIATDGESYGHHHKFGDMALAYTLNSIDQKGQARLTNYGEYLAKFPPAYEVEIYENTSWSCAHGVERWRSDCGCNSGGHPGWSQQWRGPLRAALDKLRDAIIKPFEDAGRRLFKDPWAARDEYVSVILDRSEASINAFLARHASGALSVEERSSALLLMELQRHAMLMYTSCGWFFDELSGIETVQIMQYAGRAIQIARRCFSIDLEEAFLNDLKLAKSNVAAYANGADIYRKFVKPSVVGLEKVCAHFAISSLFEQYPLEAKIYCYSIRVEDYRKQQAGRTELVVGRCHITSGITGRTDRLEFGMIYLGNHDFTCGVRDHADAASYETMASELTEGFEHGSFAEVVRLIDSYFGQNRYAIGDLFKDEQRSILGTLTTETADDFIETYRRLYKEHHILMGFLKEALMPVPKAFRAAAEFTLNHDLKKLLQSGSALLKGIPVLLREFTRWGVEPDMIGLEFAFRRRLEGLMVALAETPMDAAVLLEVEDALAALTVLPFETNLWKVQNTYFMLSIRQSDRQLKDRQWQARFKALGLALGFSQDNGIKGA